MLGDAPEADVLVCVSHEGETTLTLEAAQAFAGRDVARSPARPERRSPQACDEVVVATPADRGELLPHGELHVRRRAPGARCAARTSRGSPDAVAAQLDRTRFRSPAHERWLVAGAGRDWPTALEAVLKLREGAHVAAEAHQTEQLLHGHLAAVDEGVRCFVLEGEGRAAERADAAVRALGELGCDVDARADAHPVVDIVPFQLLTVDLAEARGVDPDMIRWDEDPWDRARRSYS